MIYHQFCISFWWVNRRSQSSLMPQVPCQPAPTRCHGKHIREDGWRSILQEVTGISGRFAEEWHIICENDDANVSYTDIYIYIEIYSGIMCFIYVVCSIITYMLHMYIYIIYIMCVWLLCRNVWIASEQCIYPSFHVVTCEFSFLVIFCVFF